MWITIKKATGLQLGPTIKTE